MNTTTQGAAKRWAPIAKRRVRARPACSAKPSRSKRPWTAKEVAQRVCPGPVRAPAPLTLSLLPPIVLLALGGLLGLGAASPARAADYNEVGHELPDPAPDIEVRYRLVPERLERDSNDGAFGYVAVRVRNTGAEPHRIDLSLRSWAMPVSRFQSHHAVGVAPGEERFVSLLSPVLRDGLRVRVEVDGADLGGSASFFHAPWRGHGPRPLTAVAVVPPAVGALDWKEAVEHVTTDLSGPGSISDLEWTPLAPEDLPASWRALTGCEVVLLDPTTPGLTADHLRLLTSYVAGGGSLLVTRADTVSKKGPLQQLWTNRHHHADGAARRAIESGAPLVTGRFGLGRWAVVRGGPGDLDAKVTPAANGPPGIDRWLAAQNEPWQARMPKDLRRAPRIPGVGEIPTRGFTALIIIYVLLVGPVSFIFFKRRDGRPTRAVVLAPLVGLGLTVAILGYGFFGEGTAVRQAVFSLTLLDQQSHTATTIAARTVYAGFAPAGGVAPAAETHVARQERLDRRQQQQIETTGGLRFLGDTLPSRTPTGFLSVSHARARPRLRFRRVGEEIELLADEAIQPAERSPVLLRAPDGTFYLRRASGRLSPAAPEELPRALASILAVRSTDAGVFVNPTRLWKAVTGLPLRGSPPPLPAGSYLLQVQAPPALDRLGLDAREEYGYHVVWGTLGKEDLLDR